MFNSPGSWRNAIRDLREPLPPGHTSVFLLSLSGGESPHAPIPATDIERAEADALAPQLRAAFLARRALLRRALALRLGAAPGDIAVAADAQGAPRVTSAREPIFVSLASRGEVVAIAISDRPVGVDVELIEANPPEPAWKILHPRERDWLAQQSTEKRQESFLALWCVKEAYLKAIGSGLRREPSDIEAGFDDWDRVSVGDCGRAVALEQAFVARASFESTTAILACVVLPR
jgi:4'-phosphopantetheinyl transferase